MEATKIQEWVETEERVYGAILGEVTQVIEDMWMPGYNGLNVSIPVAFVAACGRVAPGVDEYAQVINRCTGRLNSEGSLQGFAFKSKGGQDEDGCWGDPVTIYITPTDD